MPALSVIIVNYRSAKYILQCLRSAFQFQSANKFEWIVVDNDSGDNSFALITREFPAVKWIQMGYNAGFARANNEGIRRASSDILLLLNPDTIIINDAIQLCLEKFSVSNHVACSVQLLNEDGTSQITGNFFMTGGLNHLLPLPYTGKILSFIALQGGAKKTNVPKASVEQKVDWINGAFMMVKKESAERSGFFNEDFFLYAEEIEWCSRLVKIGSIIVYGDLHIIHLQGETINAETATTDKGYTNLHDRKGLQLMVSNNLRIRKQYGIFWFVIHLLGYTFTIPIFLLLGFISVLLGKEKWPLFSSSFTGFVINVSRLWLLSFKIISNKPYFYKML